MASEVREESIDQLMAILEINRARAIGLLETHENDVESAIAGFFGEQTRDSQPRQGWEEGPFHSDKTEWDNHPAPALTVNGGEVLGPDVFKDKSSRPDSTPTRPPSPDHANNPPAVHIGAGSSYVNSMEEDDDMKKAMQLSMEHYEHQELGVTEASGNNFGRATRSNYDLSKWAITSTNAQSQTHEIYLDPEPEKRRRKSSQPAFLRPSHNSSYLGPLLTILQYVPLAQEALLLRSSALEDYGSHEKWWTGVPIPLSRIVDLQDDSMAIDYDEVVMETQRLMAFLAKTERSYGSVDVLANLDIFRSMTNITSPSMFFEKWAEQASKTHTGEDLSRIFHSKAISVVKNDEQNESNLLSFSVLDVLVEKEIADQGLSLYDSLDSLIWPDKSLVEMTEAYISSMANVMMINLDRQDPSETGAGLKIPAVWYADRYLQANQQHSLKMREEKFAIHDILSKLTEAENALHHFSIRTAKEEVEPQHLIKISIEYLESLAKRDDQDDVRNIDSDSLSQESETLLESIDSYPSSDQQKKYYEDAVSQLQQLSLQMDDKLKTMNEQREFARSRLRECSKLLTTSADDIQPNPTWQYRLVGVITGSNVFYVLKPIGEEDEDCTADARRRGSQWWKIEFNAALSSPASITQVQELQVLKAAKEDGKGVVLVYANSIAMQASEPESLPPGLEEFIRIDNLLFKEELTSPHHRFPMTPPSDTSETFAEHGDWEEEHGAVQIADDIPDYIDEMATTSPINAEMERIADDNDTDGVKHSMNIQEMQELPRPVQTTDIPENAEQRSTEV